ncbi:unnamed protein product [Clonostachys byssicola]|uniref:Protein kinase domain-containing protein n=1 Tax=Clonostachys byssicola TaxID=160290 RepID=A0A9N9U4V5_9HYPO|nr:unnamed protein product [Clonostachys byssicola]
MAEPLQSPYVKGNTLTLSVRRVGKKSPLQLDDGDEVRARIVDVIEPATLSVVVVVEVDAPSKQEGQTIQPTSTVKMVLKVFDRRFSSQLREELKSSGPSTLATEKEYLGFLEQGSMADFVANYNKDYKFTSDDWDSPMQEAHFSLTCARMKETEARIYDYLGDLQGIHIPTFYADVQIASKPVAGEQIHRNLAKYLDVGAILIEYIPGFLLSDMVTESPEPAWPGICDQAIQVVHKIIGHHFVNTDMQTRNVIVRRDGEENYQVFYIDFGLCDFRDPLDSDEVWMEYAYQNAEENRIGWSLANAISRAKGKKGKRYKGKLPLPWEFTPSNRFRAQDIDDYPKHIWYP